MKRKHKKVYHTHERPGSRVRVHLVDGTAFVDKLKEYPQGKAYEFYERGKVRRSEIVKIEKYGKSREIHTALLRVNRKAQDI